jgi:glycosyltransferase involved in cell wall biosynthesis
MELIVIDSGSADGTLDILRSYSAGSFPVKVISAPNCSPGPARNRGLENAAGDYISFCDSDDVMKPDMLKTLHAKAAAEKTDIAVCDFDIVYPQQTVESFARLSDDVFQISAKNVADYYYRFSAAPKPNNYVWSRLYRREFLAGNGIRFPETRYSEDHLLNLSALLKTPRIVHVRQSLYQYVQRDDSAMREHIRRGNHGLLFLDSFNKAVATLNAENERVAKPILAIYAYTRLRSIMFYAWQAKLPEAEIKNAVTAFAVDEAVKKSLVMCLEGDYIGHYCRLHSFSAEGEDAARAMLRACADGAALPDMSEVFA